MKFKKIISAVVSAAMCFSMFTVGASADLEPNSGLNLMSNQNNEEIVDLQFINTQTIYDSISQYDVVTFDNNTNLLNENSKYTEPYDVLPTSDYDISTYATANPLSDLKVIGISTGNFDSEELDTSKWNWIDDFEPTSSSASVKIDATDSEYLCVRVFQWGYSSGDENMLDKKYNKYIRSVAEYNALGKPVQKGDILYGWVNDYIFEIPKEQYSSSVRIWRFSNLTSPSTTKQVNINITWTTPTAPAPTTPQILYNISNANDYAVVTGLSKDMEYRGKFGESEATCSSWNAVTGEAMLVPIYDTDYIFQVRYKSAINGLPSLNCNIVVKSRSAAPQDDVIGYNDILEVVAIYQSDKQIEVALGDSAGYFPQTSGYYTIASFIDGIPIGGLDRIYFRYAATADEPASLPAVLTLYGRNPNIPNDVYYLNGMLCNLTPDMVFRFNGGDWYSTSYSEVNITSFLSKTDTTLFEIKYVPTDNTSCSKTRQIILPALSE